MSYLIWWTDQSDCERIDYLGTAGELGHWPKYLHDEYRSRYGRNGRGRLWVAKEFEKDSECPEEAQFALNNPVCRMASECGGIVIQEIDSVHVRHLPGFVTTFEMKLYVNPC